MMVMVTVMMMLEVELVEKKSDILIFAMVRS